MREIFRDIMLALGVVFAGLSAYFQWRGPVPTDPPTAQTVANHPVGGLIVVAVLFIIAGLLNSTPLLSRFMPAGKEKRASEQLPTDELCEALKEIANTDAENMNERVREINQRKMFYFRPGSDPYIDIITELWNGSVFQLVSYGEIAGHVAYGSKQLAGEPRVIVSVEPPLLSLNHSDSVTLTVRQYLSTEVADRMEANRNRGIAIDFESVFVSFKILPLDGLTKMDMYKWQGPAKFAIEDTTRV